MKLRETSHIVKFNMGNFIWIVAVHIIALVGAVCFFSWQGLIAFAIVHLFVSMVGITFGYHRLLTHKAFKAHPALQAFAAFCGTLACQGGPISWVGQHRVHHAYSDREGDPHNINKGFWHSHMGFIFNRRLDLDDLDEVSHYCPDIAKSGYYRFLDKNMILVQFLFGFFLMALGGFIGWSGGFNWAMAVSFAIWGVFVRLVVGYHVTWLVNSATHKWGSRLTDSQDLSRNNWWVGILAFGEGWHNNHHAQPRSARHGWLWYQVDFTWMFIKTMSFCGLITDIKYPNIPTKHVVAVEFEEKQLHGGPTVHHCKQSLKLVN